MNTTLRTKEEVVEILSNSPTVQVMTEISSIMNLPVYLAGGAIRDLFLGKQVEGDWDFYIVSKEKKQIHEIVKRYKEISESKKYPDCAPISKVDLKITFDIVANVQQFDFSINCIIYDCSSQEISDPEHGIRDIKEGRLRIPHKTFFVTAVQPFIRAFRFAQEFEFSLDDSVLTTIKEFKVMTHSTDSRGRSNFLNALFQYFSLPSLSPTLPMMMECQLLETCFPFLYPLTKHKPQGSQQRAWDENVASILYLEKVVNELPQGLREEVLSLQYDRRVAKKIKFESKFNWLSEIRFAALLFNLHHAYLNLSEDLPQFFGTPKFRIHSMKSVLEVFSKSVSLNPSMLHRISESAKILAVTEHCLQECQKGRVDSFISKIPANELAYKKAILLVMARIKGVDGQKHPRLHEASRKLLGYLSQ